MKILITLASTLLLSGCATLIGSSTDKPIEPDPEGRSMGEVIDDNSLATRLQVNLAKSDARFEQANITVHANAGVVLIVGQVPQANMVAKATEIARNDPQVKAVHNHLTVGPNSSAGVRANDTWLATKVRSRMFTTDDFPSSKVNIVVEKGIVYLMGRVGSDTAQEAAKLAAEVNGVQKVVTVFTIAR